MATETEIRLTALKAARDSGVLTVKHGETSTTYRSLNEINALIRQLEGEVSGTVVGPRVSYIWQTGKGL